MSTTLTDLKRIAYNKFDRDYSAYFDEQLIGIFPTFHAAECALDDHALYLAEQGLIDAPLAAQAEQALVAACELPNWSADPFADPRTDEEKRWEAEGWTEVEGGWEKFGPHPFDESKTVRHLRARLFTTDPTPLPEPDDLPTGNDPAPGRAIAREFHRDFKGFARRQSLKDEHELRRDAIAYAAYVSARLPNQPPLSPDHVMMIWRMAAARTTRPSPPIHPLLIEADASAESYASKL